MYTRLRSSKRRDSDTSRPAIEQDLFVANPWLWYILALLPSLIIVLLLGFNTYLLKHGGLPAWEGIEHAVLSNPRLAAQLVTAFGSFLTSVVKWGLGQAVTFAAQRRFLRYRSVYEAEVWSSLKNGGILWTSWSQGWRRWTVTVLTTIIVVLCGLLTSGFVSLFTPLSIDITRGIIVAGETEADLSPACYSWADETHAVLGNTTCEAWLEYKGFSYHRCGTAQQVVDGLDAGRAAMLAHIQPVVSPGESHRFLTTYARLGSARILGGTAGTIPMGPAGIKPFSQLTSQSYSTFYELNSLPTTDVEFSQIKSLQVGIVNYTLTQQGIWYNVSCQYVNPSDVPYRWPLAPDSNGRYTLDTTCPGRPPRNRTVDPVNNFLFSDICDGPDSETWTLYLQSGLKFNQVPEASSNEAFAGIGSMICTLKPQLRAIRTTYDSHLGGFRMEPEENNMGLLEPGNRIIQRTMSYVWYSITKAQTPERHLLPVVVDNVAVSEYGLPGGVKDERYPALVASMLKGMMEYEMTLERLVPTLSTLPAPEGCRLNVTGSLTYSAIGWNAQSSTVLALTPLTVLSIILAALIIRAFLGDFHPETRLKAFDPTSAVSLIATASAGGVSFDSTVGNPEDEGVRVVKVKYGQMKMKEGVDRWGLVMEDLDEHYS